MSARLPGLALALSLLGAPTLAQAHEAASPGAAAKRPFGPWDAGETRAVKRQGRAGLPRAEHPMVGDAAKVPAAGPPAPPLRRDEDVPETALAAPNRAGSSLRADPLYLASLFYANFLTKVDGPRCQHLPTCSRFASQAVTRHGPVGFLMGLERLIQDDFSSEIRRLPEVQFGESTRLFDPLENYEFWNAENMTGFPPPTKEEPLALTEPGSDGGSPRTPSAAEAAPASEGEPPDDPIARAPQAR